MGNAGLKVGRAFGAEPVVDATEQRKLSSRNDDGLFLVSTEAGRAHPRRLKMIAHSIANSCRKYMGRSGHPQTAIRDWEADLDWLYIKRYRNRFTFRWPK